MTSSKHLLLSAPASTGWEKGVHLTRAIGAGQRTHDAGRQPARPQVSTSARETPLYGEGGRETKARAAEFREPACKTPLVPALSPTSVRVPCARLCSRLCSPAGPRPRHFPSCPQAARSGCGSRCRACSDPLWRRALRVRSLPAHLSARSPWGQWGCGLQLRCWSLEGRGENTRGRPSLAPPELPLDPAGPVPDAEKPLQTGPRPAGDARPLRAWGQGSRGGGEPRCGHSAPRRQEACFPASV